MTADELQRRVLDAVASQGGTLVRVDQVVALLDLPPSKHRTQRVRDALQRLAAWGQVAGDEATGYEYLEDAGSCSPRAFVNALRAALGLDPIMDGDAAVAKRARSHWASAWPGTGAGCAYGHDNRHVGHGARFLWSLDSE